MRAEQGHQALGEIAQREVVDASVALRLADDGYDSICA
jgi:hypothetical protein